MPEFITSKTVKARKPHRCECCTVAIQPGDTYCRETYVHDGSVYDWVSCTECAAINADVWDWCYQPDEGVGADEYAEWASEHPDDPRALAYLARRGGGES